MYLKQAYVKIYKTNEKSFQALVGYHEKENKTLPLLMLTASKNKIPNAKEGDEYICDISLKKDNNYNIWLVIDKVHNQIGK